MYGVVHAAHQFKKAGEIRVGVSHVRDLRIFTISAKGLIRMAKFGCSVIGLAALMTGAVATHAADLSVTPIYKARPSDEQFTIWRIIAPDKALPFAGKSQDKAPLSIAEDALSHGIVAGAYAWPKAPSAGTAE